MQLFFYALLNARLSMVKKIADIVDQMVKAQDVLETQLGQTIFQLAQASIDHYIVNSLYLMNFMNWKLLIILGLLISACKVAKEEKNNVEIANKFVKTDSLIIKIDEIGTVDHTTIASYYDDDGGAVAIIRTTVDKRYIDIFDVETGELLNRIPIEYEGPDGVGNEISNIVISDPNSVYIFNQWTGLLTLHNKDGQVVNKYNINFNKLGERGFLSPGAYGLQNYISHNNKIYFPGWLPWAHQSKSTEQIGVVNLKTNEVSTTFSRPEQYEKYMWGVGTLYDLYMDFNSKSEELILNFPIENDLILLNPENGKNRRVKANSQHFSEIKPFSSDFNGTNRDLMIEHGNSIGIYGGVVFDPSNNYIYRLAYSPYSNLDGSVRNKRDLTLIIIDDKLKIVNEIPFNQKGLDMRMEFTSKSGWNILNSRATNEKEGQLVFDIYSYR